MPFSVQEKVTELRREVQMRKRVYGNRVKALQMSQQQADRQLGLMQEILQDYEAQERAGAGVQKGFEM